MEKKIFAGVDIGGTFVRMGILDEDLNTLDYAVSKSDAIRQSAKPLETLELCIREYLEKHAGRGKLSGIGLGIPGTVDKGKGAATSVPNVRTLENLPVAKHLENAFQVPVVLENDVSLHLLYEIKKKEASKRAPAS